MGHFGLGLALQVDSDELLDFETASDPVQLVSFFVTRLCVSFSSACLFNASSPLAAVALSVDRALLKEIVFAIWIL